MSRATEDIAAAGKLLQAAALFIPEGLVRSEVAFLARRCGEIIKNVRDVEAGVRYRCTCCGVIESEVPLGPFDPNKCGPCYNGVCRGVHPEPVPGVAHPYRSSLGFER